MVKLLSTPQLQVVELQTGLAELSEKAIFCRGLLRHFDGPQIVMRISYQKDDTPTVYSGKKNNEDNDCNGHTDADRTLKRMLLL